MKLTKSQLRGYGLHIDQGTDDDVLDTAIHDAEMLTILPAIGQTAYGEVMAMEDTDAALTGGLVNGEYVSGYLRAAAYIAFGYLLCNEAQSTVFGPVTKRDDDYSQRIDPVRDARRRFAEGLTMLQELCRVKGWKYNTPSLPTAQVSL